MLRSAPLVLVLIALLAGSCGDEEEVTPATATTPAHASTVTVSPSPSTASVTPSDFGTIPAESVLDPETVGVERTVCSASACLTVNSIIFHPFKPESEGIDGVLVDITIENISDGDITYEVSQFIAVDTDGFVYQPHEGAGTPPLGASTVPSGLKARGQILFDMTEGAQPRELRWNAQAASIVVPLTPE